MKEDAEIPAGVREIPSPQRLFAAYEQPQEADRDALEYLGRHPEYRQYIQRVLEMERLCEELASKDEEGEEWKRGTEYEE